MSKEPLKEPMLSQSPEALLHTTPVDALKAGFSKPVWWAVFAVTTVLMSRSLAAFKQFTLLPNWGSGLWLVSVLTAFLLGMLVLAYDSYVKEKAKGTVQNPFGLFDWVQKRLQTNVFIHNR